MELWDPSFDCFWGPLCRVSWFIQNRWAMKKKGPWLFRVFFGDEISYPNYVGIILYKPWNKDRISKSTNRTEFQIQMGLNSKLSLLLSVNNQYFFMKSQGRFFLKPGWSTVNFFPCRFHHQLSAESGNVPLRSAETTAEANKRGQGHVGAVQ